MSELFGWDLVVSASRMALPLLFAALGGLLSERSGVVNIALEAKMLFGAFAGAAVAAATGSAWLGWTAGFAAGAMTGALYSALVLEGRSDQIVAGTALNVLAIGLIPFLSKIFFDSTGSTPSLPLSARFSWQPFAWAAFALIAVIILIHRTRAGLWITFAGENPLALKSVGISVSRLRRLALIAGGGLAGWGGATLSLALASSYSPLMTSGRGFIALAALIAGRWAPVPTALACFGFGVIDAAQIRLQGVSIGDFQVPVQFIQIFPYLLTLALLAGFVGASRAPKALGKGLEGEEPSL